MYQFSLKEYSSFSNERQQQSQFSRLALNDCLIKLNQKIKLDHTNNEICHFHHLKNYPEILCSLSHTRGVGAAVAAIKSPSLLSVGIDIELTDRPIESKIEPKFINPKDVITISKTLEKWCVKEACYKAASSFCLVQNIKGPITLKDIIVKNENFNFQNLSGCWEKKEIHLQSKTLLVVFAFLKKA